MKTTLAAQIATAVSALRTLPDGHHARPFWDDVMSSLSDLLPSGSGIDSGTTIKTDDCKPEKLVLSCEFHHMNDVGSYDGWTDHKIIVTPSWDGINVKVTGRDRNQIKDCLGDTFHFAMSQDVADLMEQIRSTHFPRKSAA